VPEVITNGAKAVVPTANVRFVIVGDVAETIFPLPVTDVHVGAALPAEVNS
jgi:hypothetical protein